MWIYIVLIPPAAWLTLLLHELSHLLVMKYTGAKIVRFRPYPHFSDGKFWFGYVSCMWAAKEEPTDYKYSHIAPLAKSSVFAVIWFFLGFLVWSPLYVFAVWELIDWLWWFVGWWRPGKDAYMWAEKN